MSKIDAYSPWAIIFGMNSKVKAVFFRQLATMVHSGLPVGRAVSTSSESGCQKIGAELAALVDQGACLSEAMAKYPYHFSRHEIALVKAGESSGQLDRQLNELAAGAELEWQLRKKISSKMVYPALVAHSAVFLPPLFLLVTYGLAAYIKAVLVMLVPAYVIIGGGFLAYRFFRQHGGPRRVMDHCVSAIPFLGTPGILGARIRFLHTLANLIEAGFIPGQAIPLAAEASDNFWLRDRIMTSWKRLGKEVNISSIMENSQGFASFEVGLVVTGEESGQFTATLKKAAETIKPEYEAQIHRLTVILPVVMLFVVGGIVGLTAIRTMSSIFAPIMSL